MPESIGGCDSRSGARNANPGGQIRMRGASASTTLIAIAVVIVLLAAGAWWFMGRSRPASTPAAQTPAAASAPAAVAAADVNAPAVEEQLSIDQLYKEARIATKENRSFAPAGKNALEYYLAIIARQPDDTDARDALLELFPFATGNAEEQINNGNFDEANRIMDLLAKADPSNYTLTILRSKLDAKKKQKDREAAQDAQKALADAAAAARAQAAANGPAAPASDTAAADAAAAAAAATAAAEAAKRAELARATPAPAAAPPPTPEPVGETRDVVVVTPPRPTYPAAAVRNRQDGWVEVEFTVAASGAVQNVKVVNSEPSRVFDREAVRAVQQAKFEPRLDRGKAVASTLRRRIEFKLGR